MVNAIGILSALFFLLLSLFSILGGSYQLYQAIIGNEEQLQVGGRFKFLFGFKEPTLIEKRLFWSVGGILLVLGGLMFLGFMLVLIRSIT